MILQDSTTAVGSEALSPRPPSHTVATILEATTSGAFLSSASALLVLLLSSLSGSFPSHLVG